MRVLVVLAALGLTLAACGGTDAREAATQARESAAAREADAAPEDATSVPEALKAFRCEADDDSAWFAVGDVANTTEQPTSYRVTVQVGEAGADVAAAVVDLDDVPAGEEASFTFDELPAAGSDGPCRVQVLALPPS